MSSPKITRQVRLTKMEVSLEQTPHGKSFWEAYQAL